MQKTSDVVEAKARLEASVGWAKYLMDDLAKATIMQIDPRNVVTSV
jgi:hypothetical protein